MIPDGDQHHQVHSYDIYLKLWKIQNNRRTTAVNSHENFQHQISLLLHFDELCNIMTNNPGIQLTSNNRWSMSIEHVISKK